MTHFKERREINNVEDFNEAASQIFEEFLEGFTLENGLIREINEEDTDAEYLSFMYTHKGQRLAERMQTRLHLVGAKYFDPLDIEIDTPLYKEI